MEAMCSNLASNSAHSKERGEMRGWIRSRQQIPGDHWNPFDTPFMFTAVVAAMVEGGKDERPILASSDIRAFGSEDTRSPADPATVDRFIRALCSTASRIMSYIRLQDPTSTRYPPTNSSSLPPSKPPSFLMRLPQYGPREFKGAKVSSERKRRLLFSYLPDWSVTLPVRIYPPHTDSTQDRFNWARVRSTLYHHELTSPALCSGGFFALDKISGFKRVFSLEDTS